ncbi:unnamed protein product [Closterium sp. NIES-54]
MYITLYFIVTRLPDSLRAVRGHFLALDPTDLTVDLLEKHLLAAETSVVAIGASRGTPRTPFFEGCSPSPLAPSYASAAAVDILGAEDVRAASALSGKHRSSKGKGGTSGGGGSGGGGGGGSGGGGGGGGGGSGGSGGGSGGFVGSSGGSGGGGGGGGSGSGGGGSGGERGGAVQQGGSGGGQRQQQQQHQSETPTPQQLRDRAGQTCRKFHTQHRCFSHLDDAWRSDFGDEAECPRWLELLRYGVDIFALEYDAILAAMYALSASAEGDCYLCVSPDPGIEVAALSASDSALSGTGTAEALHTFTLDSGASRCFFRDSTTLTPLPAPVSVRMSDPSGGPVLAHSSTVLSCPAVPSGSLSCLELPSFSTNLVSTAALHDAMVTTTTPGGQPVSIYTCTRTSHHLATFTCRPGSSLYTMTAEPPQVAASAQSDSSSSSGSVRTFLSCVCIQTEVVSSPPTSCGTFVMGRAFSSPVWYTAHQLNLWPRVSLLETSPTLRWTGKVGDASVFRVWGSHAFVRDTSADNLSSHAIPCDITFDESVPFYHLFPYRTASLLPLLLFLAPGPHPVEPLPPQGPAPSRVSQVDPLPLAVSVKVTVDSHAARGAASRGAASGGAVSGGAEFASAELGGAEPEGAEPGGVESEGAEFGGAEPEGAEPGGTEPEGAEPRGAESEGAESWGAEPRGTASAEGPARASPRLSHWREPLSPQ